MPVFNFGGGGAGVSLKVKAYQSFPLTANENEIGIITTTPITGYYVGSTAPAASADNEGLVWIRPNGKSPTPIPLTRKNDFFFYPLAAEQVQSGVWVQVRAMCYQNGAWTGWLKYAFKSSDVSLAEANILDFRSGNTNVAKVEKERIYIDAGSAQIPRICSHTNVNVTDYRFLKMDVTHYSGSSTLYYGLNNAYDVDGSTQPNVISGTCSRSTGIKTLDISAITGTYYIKIAQTTQSERRTDINAIWLEG